MATDYIDTLRLYFLMTSSMSSAQFQPIMTLSSDSLTNRDLELLSLAVCQPGQSRPGKTSQDNSVRDDALHSSVLLTPRIMAGKCGQVSTNMARTNTNMKWAFVNVN